MSKIREQMRKLKSRRGGIWKPEIGKNTIRILPPWSSEGLWYKESLTHYVKAEGKTRAINCPGIEGEACYICETRDDLRRSPRRSDQKQAESLRPELQYIVNMVDMENPDDGVQMGKLSTGVVNELLTYFMDNEWGDFTDPRRGYNVIVVRIGAGLQTQYSVKLSRKATRVKKTSWLNSLLDLDEKFVPASYSETQAIFGEGDEEEEYEEEEDDEEEYDEEDED
jgi:hypothetical protein